ncbi:MAG: type II toxin-antitoxin system VapC family toxin [Methanosphaera sp.]|nr:type II toxin-antitoxin system VapC family toxin [Methanosphaera sp.]
MIFLDSSFIIALFNKKEYKRNKSAEKIIKTIPDIDKIPKAINNIVLNEVLNKLTKPYYDGKREQIISFLLAMDKIIFVSENDYKKAIKLYKKYDYTINYSDWLIILSMKKEGITDILSFDDDFNKIKEINNISI